MRITSGILESNVLRNLQQNLSALSRTQTELSSGQKIQTMSDDPVLATQVVQIDAGLRAQEQYRRNITATRAKSDAEEAVLNQVNDLLTRAKELAIQEGSSTASPATHVAAGAEVTQIINQVIQLGNTRVGNQYIFGGYQTGTAPFSSAGVYGGDAGQPQAEIGDGYFVTTNVDGSTLMMSSGVLSGLQNLQTQLQTGTTATIASSATQLDAGLTSTQTLLSGNGARAAQLQTATQNIDALSSSMTIRRSSYADVDVAAAMVHYATLQSSYQAALQTASRILTTNLTEYMK